MTEITVILTNPPTAIDYVSHTEADVVNLAGAQLKKWLLEGIGVGMDVKCKDEEIRGRVIKRLDAVAGEVMAGYHVRNIATRVIENAAVAAITEPGNRKERRARVAQKRSPA